MLVLLLNATLESGSRHALSQDARHGGDQSWE